MGGTGGSGPEWSYRLNADFLGAAGVAVERDGAGRKLFIDESIDHDDVPAGSLPLDADRVENVDDIPLEPTLVAPARVPSG